MLNPPTPSLSSPAAMMMTMMMMMMMMMMMLLGTGVRAAPTERGLAHTPDQPDSLIVSVPPERTDPSLLRQQVRQWLLTAGPPGPERTTRTAARTTARPERRPRLGPKTAGPDRRAQMLRMISALEELHRTINSTRSTRITIMTRANGRNSGRKNKVLPAVEGSPRPTTVPPVDTDETASRPGGDIVPSSLTGRNFKKSLPPQPKKTNKRVCFWKYCSQN